MFRVGEGMHSLGATNIWCNHLTSDDILELGRLPWFKCVTTPGFFPTTPGSLLLREKNSSECIPSWNTFTAVLLYVLSSF